MRRAHKSYNATLKDPVERGEEVFFQDTKMGFLGSEAIHMDPSRTCAVI